MHRERERERRLGEQRVDTQRSLRPAAKLLRELGGEIAGSSGHLVCYPLG